MAGRLRRRRSVEAGFLQTGTFLGWVDTARALPHRIAKAVTRSIHWMDRPPCLLTSLGRFALFLRGPAPAPPQPLKRLAKLLCCSNPFGAVVDLGKLPFFRANLPFFAAILREFEIFFYIPEITVEK